MSTRNTYTRLYRTYPDALTVKDLQQMLGISKNLAYKLVNQNSVEHTQIGRKMLIPKVSVIDYLVKNHTTTNT